MGVAASPAFKLPRRFSEPLDATQNRHTGRYQYPVPGNRVLGPRSLRDNGAALNTSGGQSGGAPGTKVGFRSLPLLRHHKFPGLGAASGGCDELRRVQPNSLPIQDLIAYAVCMEGGSPLGVTCSL
jgi:hypothetical protein